MAQSDSDRTNSVLREMERTSHDLIRIYNPTDTDFTILWDGFKHVVPHKDKDIGYGKGQRVVQRYLAIWYLKHMTDKIITDKQDTKLKQLQSKYENAGIEDSLVKAQLEVERNRGVRTDNPDEVARIGDIIWLGVEEKYGIDMEIEEKPTIGNQLPLHEQIAEKLKDKRVVSKFEASTEVSVPKESPFPINKNKKKLVEEVAKI
jgi:hypothetical protein